MTRYTRLQRVTVLGALLMVIAAVAVANVPAGARARVSASSPISTAPIQVLVNAQGMTLYLFTPDKKNQSSCTGQCATFWPPLLLPSGADVPSTVPGINGTFGVAGRPDGSKQLTYNGAPLYTFVKDKKPGDMTGQGAGGTWWVAAASSSQSSGAGIPTSSLVRTAPAQMLVNVKGLALYIFTPDKKNQSTCTGQCATYWPPVELASGTQAPPAVPGISGTFGVAARADGSKQLTFNGAPLYTFVKDKKSGDMTGQGIGGTWWIVVLPASTSTAAPVRAAPAQILVNAQGMTLYLFTLDKKNQSTCTGQCATFWPPLLIASGTQAPSAVAGISGTFGVAARADGSKQLTFNGAPLYTFVKDKKPGDMTGQGVGGTWWAVVLPTSTSTTAPSAQAAQASSGDDNGHHDDHGHKGGGSSASATPTPAGSYYNGNHGGDG